MIQASGMRNNVVKVGFAGILSLVMLSACSSMNTKIGGLFNMDTDLDLTFIADKNINPDANATPSPLFIRMYELKSDKAFKNADFIDIYERDKEVLGDDMLGKQRLKRLIPGEKREKDFVLDPQTHFVGLFAEFQSYKDATYKVIIPVEPTNVVASSSVVRVSGNIISASQ